VAQALDSSQMHLARPPLPDDTLTALSVEWAEQLAVLGVSNEQINVVFWEALNAKTNDYQLTWPEIRSAANRVVRRSMHQPTAPQPLDDGDCDFLLSMVLPWLEVHDEAGRATGVTPESKAYVRELRSHFRAHASTPKERAVLKVLESLPLD